MLPNSAALDAAALPDAVVSVDAEGRIVAANRVFERLLWGPDTAPAGKSFFDVYKPRDADGKALSGWHSSAWLPNVVGVPEVEVELTHPSGRVVSVAVTVAYVRDADGRFAGGVASMRDLAHRRIDSAAAQAVATVAHEIRAPLTGIRGFASLLLNKSDALTADQHDEMLAQIVKDAERMTRLVTELLDMSRLEAGILVLGSEPVDLARTCRDAVAEARGGVEGADDQQVSVDVPEPVEAIGDADKIGQVVRNLVENAFKYGEAPVTIHAYPRGDDAIVEVHDCGSIEADALGRIFSKYWRRSRAGRPSGTGLGLYISKGLAEAHGGGLEVDSDDDGTTFRLLLPQD